MTTDVVTPGLNLENGSVADLVYRVKQAIFDGDEDGSCYLATMLAHVAHEPKRRKCEHLAVMHKTANKIRHRSYHDSMSPCPSEPVAARLPERIVRRLRGVGLVESLDEGWEDPRDHCAICGKKNPPKKPLQLVGTLPVCSQCQRIAGTRLNEARAEWQQRETAKRRERLGWPPKSVD